MLRINGPRAYRAQTVPTLGLVIDRFIKEERIDDILKQKPGEATITDGISYSTAAGYRSYIRNHIESEDGHTLLWLPSEQWKLADWLKSLHTVTEDTWTGACPDALAVSNGPCCGN